MRAPGVLPGVRGRPTVSRWRRPRERQDHPPAAGAVRFEVPRDPAPPPGNVLLSLFMGKRRWIRVPALHLVRIRGEGCAYSGRLLDLSRGGLQLVIENAPFGGGLRRHLRPAPA